MSSNTVGKNAVDEPSSSSSSKKQSANNLAGADNELLTSSTPQQQQQQSRPTKAHHDNDRIAKRVTRSAAPVHSLETLHNLINSKSYHRYTAELNKQLHAFEKIASSDWSAQSMQLQYILRCIEVNKELVGIAPLPDPLLFCRAIWRGLEPQNVLGVQRKALEVLQSYTAALAASPWEQQQWQQEISLPGYVSPLATDYPYLILGVLDLFPRSSIQLKEELLSFIRARVVQVLPPHLLQTCLIGVFGAVLHCLEEPEASPLHTEARQLLMLLRRRVSQARDSNGDDAVVERRHEGEAARGSGDATALAAQPSGGTVFFAVLWSFLRDNAGLRAATLIFLKSILAEESEVLLAQNTYVNRQYHHAAASATTAGGDEGGPAARARSSTTLADINAASTSLPFEGFTGTLEEEMERRQREWLGGVGAHQLVHTALMCALQDTSEKVQRLTLDVLIAYFPIDAHHADVQRARAGPQTIILSSSFGFGELSTLVAASVQLLGLPGASASVLRRVALWLCGPHPETAVFFIEQTSSYVLSQAFYGATQWWMGRYLSQGEGHAGGATIPTSHVPLSSSSSPSAAPPQDSSAAVAGVSHTTALSVDEKATFCALSAGLERVLWSIVQRNITGAAAGTRWALPPSTTRLAAYEVVPYVWLRALTSLFQCTVAQSEEETALAAALTPVDDAVFDAFPPSKNPRETVAPSSRPFCTVAGPLMIACISTLLVALDSLRATNPHVQLGLPSALDSVVETFLNVLPWSLFSSFEAGLAALITKTARRLARYSTRVMLAGSSSASPTAGSLSPLTAVRESLVTSPSTLGAAESDRPATGSAASATTDTEHVYSWEKDHQQLDVWLQQLYDVARVVGPYLLPLLSNDWGRADNFFEDRHALCRQLCLALKLACEAASPSGCGRRSLRASPPTSAEDDGGDKARWDAVDAMAQHLLDGVLQMLQLMFFDSLTSLHEKLMDIEVMNATENTALAVSLQPHLTDVGWAARVEDELLTSLLQSALVLTRLFMPDDTQDEATLGEGRPLLTSPTWVPFMVRVNDTVVGVLRYTMNLRANGRREQPCDAVGDAGIPSAEVLELVQKWLRRLSCVLLHGSSTELSLSIARLFLHIVLCSPPLPESMKQLISSSELFRCVIPRLWSAAAQGSVEADESIASIFLCAYDILPSWRLPIDAMMLSGDEANCLRISVVLQHSVALLQSAGVTESSSSSRPSAAVTSMLPFPFVSGYYTLLQALAPGGVGEAAEPARRIASLCLVQLSSRPLQLLMPLFISYLPALHAEMGEGNGADGRRLCVSSEAALGMSAATSDMERRELYRHLEAGELVTYLSALLHLPNALEWVMESMTVAIPPALLKALRALQIDAGAASPPLESKDDGSSAKLQAVPLNVLFTAMMQLLLSVAHQFLLSLRFEVLKETEAVREMRGLGYMRSVAEREHKSCAVAAVTCLNRLLHLVQVSSPVVPETVAQAWRALSSQCVSLLYMAVQLDLIQMQLVLLECLQRTVTFVDDCYDSTTTWSDGGKPPPPPSATTATKDKRWPYQTRRRRCQPLDSCDTLHAVLRGVELNAPPEEATTVSAEVQRAAPAVLLATSPFLRVVESGVLRAAQIDQLPSPVHLLSRWARAVLGLLPHLHRELAPNAVKLIHVFLLVIERELEGPAPLCTNARRTQVVCYEALQFMVRYLCAAARALAGEAQAAAQREKESMGWLASTFASSAEDGPTNAWRQSTLLEPLRHALRRMIITACRTVILCKEQPACAFFISATQVAPLVTQQAPSHATRELFLSAQGLLQLLWAEAGLDFFDGFLKAWASSFADSVAVLIVDRESTGGPHKTPNASHTAAATPVPTTPYQCRSLWKPASAAATATGADSKKLPVSSRGPTHAPEPCRPHQKAEQMALLLVDTVGASVHAVMAALESLLNDSRASREQQMAAAPARHAEKSSASGESRHSYEASAELLRSPLTSDAVSSFFLLTLLRGVTRVIGPLDSSEVEAILNVLTCYLNGSSPDYLCLAVLVRLLFMSLGGADPSSSAITASPHAASSGVASLPQPSFRDTRFVLALSRVMECLSHAPIFASSEVAELLFALNVFSSLLPALVPVLADADYKGHLVEAAVALHTRSLMPTLTFGIKSPSETDIIARTPLMRTALRTTAALARWGEPVLRRLRGSLFSLMLAEHSFRAPGSVLHEWSLLWGVVAQDRALQALACERLAPSTSATGRLVSIVISFETEAAQRVQLLRRLAFHTLSLSAPQLNDREYINYIKDQVVDVVNTYSSTSVPTVEQLNQRKVLLEPVRAALFLFRVLITRLLPTLLDPFWSVVIPEVMRALSIQINSREHTAGASAGRNQKRSAKDDKKKVAGKLTSESLAAVQGLQMEALKLIDFVLLICPEQFAPFRWGFTDGVDMIPAHAAHHQTTSHGDVASPRSSSAQTCFPFFIPLLSHFLGDAGGDGQPPLAIALSSVHEERRCVIERCSTNTSFVSNQPNTALAQATLAQLGQLSWGCSPSPWGGFERPVLSVPETHYKRLRGIRSCVLAVLFHAHLCEDAMQNFVDPRERLCESRDGIPVVETVKRRTDGWDQVYVRALLEADFSTLDSDVAC